MFPGFVSIYKDNDSYIHLYFYPGIDDDNTNIYNTIDLSKCDLTCTNIYNDDNSIDYKFDNKYIKRISCKLIKIKDASEKIIELSI